MRCCGAAALSRIYVRRATFAREFRILVLYTYIYLLCVRVYCRGAGVLGIGGILNAMLQ